jgi:hypothetical protein
MNHDDLRWKLLYDRKPKGRINLDCGQNDAPVSMLELRDDSLADVFALLLVLGRIPRQCVQNGDAAPFRTFVESDEQFVKDV